MFDLRKNKKIDLSNSTCLKEGVTYQFVDELTGKKLIVKLLAYYNDEEDEYLIREFRKLVMLSGEPEIGAVHFLATALINGEEKSCYIMSFIEGDTLSSFLDKNQSLSQETIIDILSQISFGLEKAHHYEIFHSDLHEGNIIIDQLGYVKLIDFLWHDYKLTNTVNLKKDIADFQEIANKLFDKVIGKDNRLIKKLCSEIINFKGLGKKILLINELASDWEMLLENDRQRASVLLRNLKNNYNYNSLLIEKDIPVPDKFVPIIDEKEKEKIDKKKDLDLPDSVKRLNIDTKIRDAFLRHLLPLKQAGLLSDWKIMYVGNVGSPLVGPFTFSYWISYTPKFFTWKKISKEFDFLDSKGNTSLLDLILH